MELIKFIVDASSTLRVAIKAMDMNGMGFIFLKNSDGTIHSLITDGDFRRAILKGIKLSEKASLVGNKDFIRVNSKSSLSQKKELFHKHQLRALPVIENNILTSIIFKTDIEDISTTISRNKFDLPVIIMAGGKGTRMKPFTHILPKPLIPFGEQSILEVIMNKYKMYGVKDFYLTVNFKKNLIKAYFEDKPEYNITFIEENKPLGTAGSLKLLPEKINTPFFVSNCDIIINEDYSEIVEFHKNGNYDLTLVGSIQHMHVPYGVCTINGGGELKEIIEKPSYDFLVNTGMYLLNPSVLEFIPNDTFYHITHLMEDLKKAGKKVGVFPVSEKSWIDVGQWEDYVNTSQETIK